jgi:hypothetical protein
MQLGDSDSGEDANLIVVFVALLGSLLQLLAYVHDVVCHSTPWRWRPTLSEVGRFCVATAVERTTHIY